MLVTGCQCMSLQMLAFTTSSDANLVECAYEASASRKRDLFRGHAGNATVGLLDPFDSPVLMQLQLQPSASILISPSGGFMF